MAWIESKLGVRPAAGGRHPDWGTRNALLPLPGGAYLEIIGPDGSRPSGPLPSLFGIAALTSPRLVTWAAKGSRLAELAARARASGLDLGDVRSGSRVRPDGVRLSWSLTDPFADREGGLIPFFIDWGTSPHPAGGAADVVLEELRAEHPDPARIRGLLASFDLDLPVAEGPRPRLLAALRGPRGGLALDDEPFRGPASAGRTVLETERLRLREYRLDDEAALAEVFADPDARAFYPEMADRANVRAWIAWNLRRYHGFGFGLWAMEEKESGRLIGDCGLSYQDVEDEPVLEIGYHVRAAERRKGYALEAARACLDHGFERTSRDVIGSIVRPANVASRAVASRLHESCREFRKGGRPALLYFTTRSGWSARRRRT